MTDLVIANDDVHLVRGGDEHQHTAPALEAFNAGQYIRLDPSTGKFRKGNATSVTELGDGFFAGNKAAQAGDPVTGYKSPAVFDVGTALSGLNFGDKIYVSTTDGTFADANPLLNASAVEVPLAEGVDTDSVIAGVVVPGFGNTTGKKLFRVSLRS